MLTSIRPASSLNAEAVLPLALVLTQLGYESESERSDLVDGFRRAALGWIEQRTRRSLSIRTWVATYSGIAGAVFLPWQPVQEVTAVSYRSAAGAAVPVLLGWDADGESLILARHAGIPAGRPVAVTFTAGYANVEDEAPQLRMAALLLAQHLHNGGTTKDVPATVESLCEDFRAPVIA